MSLNQQEGAVLDFKWSNIDPNSPGSNQAGTGFIMTLSMDRTVRLYDIAKNKAECLMTLQHEVHVNSLALSPDN